MQRNALTAALDKFLGRDATGAVMRQIRSSIARARASSTPRQRSWGPRFEVEALVRQLSRTPRRR